MFLHGLGLRLGKTIEELSDMPWPELMQWLAFLEMLNDGGS